MSEAEIVLTHAEYEQLKTLLYHTVSPAIMEQMVAVRRANIALAVSILRGMPRSRSQSLALTHLEDAQMRAIQGLAMQGEAQVPPGVRIEAAP